MILIKEPNPNNRFDCTSVRIEAEVILLSEAQEVFEDFLRGCGYSWKDEEDYAIADSDYGDTEPAIGDDGAASDRELQESTLRDREPVTGTVERSRPTPVEDCD